MLPAFPSIEIERDAAKVRIHIHCAKPGMVIGKGGAEIEKLRAAVRGHDQQGQDPEADRTASNIVEVKQPR